MSVLPVRMFMYHMWGWCPEVRRVSNTLGLELQMVVSHLVGASIESWSSARASSDLNCGPISSALILIL